MGWQGYDNEGCMPGDKERLPPVFDDLLGEQVVADVNRALSGAPNVAAERSRLERSVIEKAKEEYKVEREADRGANTITRTDALIKLQPLIQRRREAVAALLEFEQKQK